MDIKEEVKVICNEVTCRVAIYALKKLSKDLWVRYGLTLINNFNNLIFF